MPPHPTAPARHLTTPDGTRIAYRDHTPPGARLGRRPVLLLHGLAGHMGEWDDLAARLLADGHRVVTYDARGHGDSTRTPPDMTRAAAVADAVTLINHLRLAPATLVGQSLGGLTALLLAARHAPLVDSLTLVEAGPAGRKPGLPAEIGAWLDSWPPVFKSRQEALAFLGHEAWMKGLDEREGGWHSRLDRNTMIAAVAELATDDYWTDWSRIACPTLVVRGENGTMPPAEAADMRSRRPSTRITVITDARHDVHLDQPESLYETIARFLND
ncbi:alpha/beta hydrolase [Streptomyces sp. NPDC020298]|uniref:alpha/beta fold hydrolase n=1 Tax=unclassified Streptomyces TaxID=2593676 RepID=UPI0033FE6187